jgi:hypothetical protein
MAEVDSGPEPAQGSGSSQSTSDYIVTLDGFDRNERVRMQTLLWRAGIVYAPRVSKKVLSLINIPFLFPEFVNYAPERPNIFSVSTFLASRLIYRQLLITKHCYLLQTTHILAANPLNVTPSKVRP